MLCKIFYQIFFPYQMHRFGKPIFYWDLNHCCPIFFMLRSTNTEYVKCTKKLFRLARKWLLRGYSLDVELWLRIRINVAQLCLAMNRMKYWIVHSALMRNPTKVWKTWTGPSRGARAWSRSPKSALSKILQNKEHYQ